tara:strand:+ start:421 stop:783 length:363 start_codon:yes stop_codon:yes gene_type:complete
MGDLTKNLSRHEFACKCECGLDTADIETVAVIQEVCDEFDCTVTINSGCRCVAHNKRVGGAQNSQHPKCRAGDCKFHGPTPDQVHKYLVKKYPGKFGFGVYATFNHIDTRTDGPARWDKR